MASGCGRSVHGFLSSVGCEAASAAGLLPSLPLQDVSTILRLPFLWRFSFRVVIFDKFERRFPAQQARHVRRVAPEAMNGEPSQAQEINRPDSRRYSAVHQFRG
jgi:hypothetical protein